MMKSFAFTIALGFLLLTGCEGGSGSGDGSGGGGDDSSFLAGNWLGDTCTSSGGFYYRIYFEMSGSTQTGAFLKYGAADTTCAGAYSETGAPPTYTPIASFLTFSTANTVLDVAGIPAGYTAFSYVASGSTKYTLAYMPTSTEVYVPGFPASSNPGSNWSDWQSDPTLAAFAANPATGVSYTKVTGLP